MYFIDTSVLLNILQVPGWWDDTSTCADEFVRRQQSGALFVLPVTTLIETGNAIAQCNGDRRAAAQRFEKAIQLATAEQPPWIIRDVQWDSNFVSQMIAGDSTGETMVDHFSHRSLGGGDLAILVERDQFRAATAYADVRIWTLDRNLVSRSEATQLS